MVKAGYKQTEIGVIPEDWESKLFQDVLEGFSSGMTPYRGIPKYYRGNIKWITSGELNYNIIYDTEEHITKEAVEKTNLKILPKGTFLMAITGLEAAGTRGSCGIVGEEATTNQSCMALFGTKKILTEYLFHYYVRYGDLLAFKFCQGTKQQSYTAKIVKILPIVYPPNIEEQKAIAEALGDTDALITSLEKLIVKKERIKQGTMQQLLTGKKRLEGFSGAWEEKRLGDLCAMSSGGTPSTKISKYYGGNIPWLSISDITDAGKYIFKTEKKLTLLGLANSAAKLFDQGTLLLAMYASIGKCCIAKVDISSSQAILGIKTNNIDTEFLYYYFLLSKSKLASSGQQGTQSNLNKGMVENISLHLPSIQEQQAIAQILSDMDNELEALKAKLAKTKAIKEGMMSELLTGKTRLKGAKDE